MTIYILRLRRILLKSNIGLNNRVTNMICLYIYIMHFIALFITCLFVYFCYINQRLTIKSKIVPSNSHLSKSTKVVKIFKSF